MSATAEGTLGNRLRREAPATMWRSLEQLDGSPEFFSFLHAEFPHLLERLGGRPDRRTALKLIGASLLMGGVAACTPPRDIVPYVEQPERIVPGLPLYYATSVPVDGFGFGVIAETHEGRPTKLAGNPDHPATRGATDPIIEATVLGLYDPDRSRAPMQGDEVASLERIEAMLASLAQAAGENGGQGLAVLVGTVTSPSLKAEIAALQQLYPQLRLFSHRPLADAAEGAATEALFGRQLRPVYDFTAAQTVLALDADIFGDGPGKLAYAAQFGTHRRIRQATTAMNRLYSVSAIPSITSASADNRLLLRADAIEAFVERLAAVLGGGAPADGDPPLLVAMAADLAATGAQALIVPGRGQSARVHALAHTLNHRSGAAGNGVRYIAPPDAIDEVEGDLYDLADAAASGAVETLVILGEDPVYGAPGDLDFRAVLGQVPLSIHLGSHRDQTAALCTWHVPQTHPLESWGDLAAYDGTVSLQQPTISPLYQSRTAAELLRGLAGSFDSWQGRHRSFWSDRGLDDSAFAQALKAGVVTGSAAPAKEVTADGTLPPATGGASRGIELSIRPDPYFLGGDFAGNLWLEELPRPLTKIVWGNAAVMSPATAARLGVVTEDVVEIAVDGRTQRFPVWVEPGCADGSIGVTLGFGRPLVGTALPSGVSAYPLRSRAASWGASDVTVTRIGDTVRLVTTQHHGAMEGRDIIRTASFAEFSSDPTAPAIETEPPPEVSLYPGWEYPNEAWGMTIDLSACIGCMACVASCQAENNIPVVGRDEVDRGHEMHWLRVDRYYSGDPADPDTHFQPVPCMHCEQAPCEVVCPVNATVHTDDGLNAQVYNRCIGTRYCSQNCPYKVRRFNFADYGDFADHSPLGELMNPDVTVRARGVMEKCTYCVQRISEARIDAGISDTPIADGVVQTACQQACPTRAITFGNINDPASAVAASKRQPHNYLLLAELNTRPRTSYLAEIRNPRSLEGDDD